MPAEIPGMGKASKGKPPGRRARIAAQREAARRSDRRRRLWIAGGSIFAVVVLSLTFALVKANSRGGTPAAASNGPTGAALTSLTRDVTGVPASVLDQVGGGSIDTSAFIPGSQLSAAGQAGSYLATVNGAPLTSGGKPVVQFVSALYCPFCAAQRWALVIALSRFGTFSGLSTVHSSSTDVYPNTPTFSFYGARYTSRYISFSSVEETTNQRQGNSSNQNVPYVPLQAPTATQDALLARYDPSSSIPFLDIGGKYAGVGNLAPYGPQDLQGKTWSQIAAALSQPTSAIAQGADGMANYLTAAICTLTGNQPATACTPAVRALEGKLAR
jgi:hypothetical protein